MIQEIAHQSALLPLALVALLGRRLPRAWWLVAAAWAVSWVGDSAAHFAGGGWWTSYLWLPVQFSLVLVAFLPTELWRLVALSGLVLLAVTSAQVSAPGPDWIFTFVASFAVLTVAEGPLLAPILIYFGAGTLAYLFMVARVGDGFMPGWYAYQGCRLAAFVVFAALLIRERRRLPWPS